MSATWTSRHLHRTSSSAPMQVDEDLLDEDVVLFLQGKNNFKDEVFSYVQLKVRNLIELKKKMDAGEMFSPGEYGTLLAAGRGVPSRELQEEMAVTYHMMDIPMAPVTLPKPVQQPLIWNDMDVQDGGDITSNEASPNPGLD